MVKKLKKQILETHYLDSLPPGDVVSRFQQLRVVLLKELITISCQENQNQNLSSSRTPGNMNVKFKAGLQET